MGDVTAGLTAEVSDSKLESGVEISIFTPPRPPAHHKPSSQVSSSGSLFDDHLSLSHNPSMSKTSSITIDPARRSGKPCIRDTRITVYDVLEYLASGMSEAEIIADFPELTADDIRSCLGFAADRERRLIGAA
jgi:uncharacterized protein (DUF433 family)